MKFSIYDWGLFFFSEQSASRLGPEYWFISCKLYMHLITVGRQDVQRVTEIVSKMLQHRKHVGNRNNLLDWEQVMVNYRENILKKYIFLD